MLDKSSSLRFTVARFPLIVGVVFIHAYSNSVCIASGAIGLNKASALDEFVRNLISQGIARTAVPLFFIMSGFLFFLDVEWKPRIYLSKIRKRTRSLLFPYLFWNVLLILVMITAQSFKSTQIFFSGKRIWDSFSFFDYCKAVFGIQRDPISYQFWFIRDLMILVLLSPVIHFVITKLPLYFFAAIFFCWYLNIHPFRIPAVEAMLFFGLGSYAAVRERSLFAWDRYGAILCLVYIPLLILDALSYAKPFNPYIHDVGILFGVIVILRGTGFVLKSQKVLRLLLILSKASFFVFAVHEPLLTIGRKLTFRAFPPQTSCTVLILYFCVPITVISISTGSYFMLSKIVPKFTALITGGR